MKIVGRATEICLCREETEANTNSGEPNAAGERRTGLRLKQHAQCSEERRSKTVLNHKPTNAEESEKTQRIERRRG